MVAGHLTRRLREEAGRFWQLVPQHDKLLFRGAGMAAGLLGLALAINGLIVQPTVLAGKGAVAKQNLHAIQLAIERSAVDSPDDTYPVTAEAVRTNYLPVFPTNPYTGQPMHEYTIDAPQVPAGDFVYYPRWAKPLGSSGNSVTGYTLAMGEGVQWLRESIARQQANGG